MPLQSLVEEADLLHQVVAVALEAEVMVAHILNGDVLYNGTKVVPLMQMEIRTMDTYTHMEKVATEEA